jgi:hypothetical protein
MSFDAKKYLERNKEPNTTPDLGLTPEDFGMTPTEELETILKEEGQINSVHYEVSMEKKSDSANKK